MVSLMITIKSKCEDIDKLYANGIIFSEKLCDAPVVFQE